MKIILNRAIGGFGVSHQILCYLYKKGSIAARDEIDILVSMDEDIMNITIDHNNFPLFNVERTDPLLIEAVEKLHETVPHLKIVEIPDEIEYYIFENEMGIESVHEKHRIWPED